MRPYNGCLSQGRKGYQIERTVHKAFPPVSSTIGGGNPFFHISRHFSYLFVPAGFSIFPAVSRHFEPAEVAGFPAVIVFVKMRSRKPVSGSPPGCDAMRLYC
jgi:hypothetical protein